MVAEATSPVDLELDNYTRVRFQEAREAGLTRLEADRFARGTEPLKTLRALKASGCPPAVIARIVI
jgi:hypothetical protein